MPDAAVISYSVFKMMAYSFSVRNNNIYDTNYVIMQVIWAL